MRSFGLCALIAVAACAPKSPPVPQLAHADAEFAIRAARNAWSLAFVRRDTASLAAQWAPNGVLSTGAGTWRGRDEIVREHYAALFRSRPDITFTRKLQRVEGQDGWQLVSELGAWVERWSEPDGLTELRGTYFTMWRRTGGDWFKLSEIFVPATCKGRAYCAPRPERPGLSASSWKVQPDPDRERRIRLRAILTDVADGIKESPALTDSVRVTIHKDPRLKELTSFEFVGCNDMTRRGVKRLGSPVNDVCYYKGNVGNDVWGFTFWLTPEGTVADFGYP